MSKSNQDLTQIIARLQIAMHQESALHSPRTTFAIEAMRAAKDCIIKAIAWEAALSSIIHIHDTDTDKIEAQNYIRHRLKEVRDIAIKALEATP